MIKFKKLLFVLLTLLVLTSLEVKAQSSGGGRHDHDGAVCTDVNCTSSILCNSTTYDNSCRSHLSPTIGNSSYFANINNKNYNQPLTNPLVRKIDLYGGGEMTLYYPTFMTNSAVKPEFMDYYRFDSNGDYNNNYFGGFYSPLISSYFTPDNYYRYQFTIYVAKNDDQTLEDFKTFMDFNLNQFEDNINIYVYDQENSQVIGFREYIDTYSVTYTYKMTSNNRLRYTIYFDFLPKKEFNSIAVMDSITPVNNISVGNISNVYFAHANHDRTHRNTTLMFESSTQSVYFLRIKKQDYEEINSSNMIKFVNGQYISFKNDISSCAVTDIGCHIHNLGSFLGNIFEGLGNILNKIFNVIADIFLTIKNAIISALQSLFIPNMENIAAINSDLKSTASEHLGLLYYPIEFLFDFRDFASSYDSENFSVPMSFPDVTLGNFGTIIHGQNFDFAEYVKIPPYKQVYDAYRVFASFLLAMFVFMFLDKFKDKILGGSDKE